MTSLLVTIDNAPTATARAMHHVTYSLMLGQILFKSLVRFVYHFATYVVAP